MFAERAGTLQSLPSGQVRTNHPACPRCKHKTRFPHAYPPPSPSTLVPCKTPQAWARLGRGLASLAVAPAAADAVVGQVSAPIPSSTSLESVPLYPNSAHRRPHDPDSHTATQSPTSPPVSLVKIAPSTVHCVQHRRSQGDARGVRYAEAVSKHATSHQARVFLAALLLCEDQTWPMAHVVGHKSPSFAFQKLRLRHLRGNIILHIS